MGDLPQSIFHRTPQVSLNRGAGKQVVKSLLATQRREERARSTERYELQVVIEWVLSVLRLLVQVCIHERSRNSNHSRAAHALFLGLAGMQGRDFNWDAVHFNWLCRKNVPAALKVACGPRLPVPSLIAVGQCLPFAGMRHLFKPPWLKRLAGFRCLAGCPLLVLQPQLL